MKITSMWLLCQVLINQRTNGTVKAHLISGPNVSTEQKLGHEMNLTLNSHLHLLN